MASIPLTDADAAAAAATLNRRLCAVLFWVVAEAALLYGLAHAAWGDLDDSSMDPLSLADGLFTVALFGIPGSMAIVAGAFSILAPRRSSRIAMPVLMGFLAGVVGFVGFALISLSRVEMSDC